jgi:hypothetical protein
MLAVLALAGQLGSFAHLVLVQHVSCADHGELIEVAPQNAIVAARTELSGPAVRASATSDPLHGHDHCTLSPLRRDHLHRIGQSSHALAPLESASPPAHGRIVVTAPKLALFLLAPKNSPPV